MRLPRFAHSLRVQLIAVGVLVVVGGGFARFAVMSNLLRSELFDLVSAEQLALATYVADDIDGKIRLRQRFLEALARELPAALLDRPAALEIWLSERYAVAPHFSLGLAVVREDGQGAIADFPPLPERRQLDFNRSDWFRAARDQGGFAIGKPTLGRLSNQGIIIMAVPWRDPQGRVAAVVYGATALDAPGFLDLIQNNAIGETGGYLLISPRDKIFVAATMPKMRIKPTPPIGVNRLHDSAMTGWRGAGVTVNAFGVEELAAFASVPAADWFVVARLPTVEAFQALNRIPRLIFFYTVTLGAVVVTVLVIVLNIAFRPMKATARHMRRIASGQEPLAPMPPVGQIEILDMVEAFNALAVKLREGEARMAHLAHHDALTGLPNRMLFLARLEQSAALAKRHDSRLALLFIDLDGFKPINDRHGHETGDQLLRQVAQRLGEGVRACDTAARFGGDEFVLLLTDIQHAGDAGTIAEKVIAKLSAPYVVGPTPLPIGASIGIAIFPDDADAVDPLIAQADGAMYAAKRAGGNVHRFARRPAPAIAES